MHKLKIIEAAKCICDYIYISTILKRGHAFKRED